MSPYYQRLRSFVGQDLLLIPGVAGLIHDEEGRLLLVQTRNGHWSLPAGAIEPGESPEDSARREVEEETGLQVSSLRLAGVLGGEAYRFTYPNGDQVETVVTLYACSCTGEIAIQDHAEIAAVRYFSEEEFPGLTLPYPRDLLFPTDHL